MRLLLDTHAFFWMLDDPTQTRTRLGKAAQAVILDGRNELLLSLASCWEVAIKHAAGRFELQMPLASFISKAVAANRIALLPITLDHLSALVALPKHPADHRDPFDRMLVSQALAEGIMLVSKDAAVDAYGVKRVW